MTQKIRTITYRGDQSAPYDDDASTGTVGKIVGPTDGGRWFVIATAAYDEELNLTRIEMQEIPPPEVLMQRLEESSPEVPA